MKAIRLNQFGGPEVLEWVDVDVPEPGPGEVQLRHTAIGLNFIDTYHRSGLYPISLPAGLGTEAAGVVEAVGADVDGLKPGDCVAYVYGSPTDAYSEARTIPAEVLVKVPKVVSDEVAAAAILKGMTSWYLLKRSYPITAGEHALVFAAAGGVGLILCQWASSLGVRVIGVVSTEAKAQLAREHGCADIVMADDDIPVRVRALTDGAGVPVVYDSVGKDTFFASLDCLKPHGVMVSYGNASGPVEPFSLAELASRGSLYVTRPTLFDFINTRAGLEEASRDLFAVIESGAVKIEINQRYPLAEAARAHTDLEARKTTGSTLLVPG